MLFRMSFAANSTWPGRSLFGVEFFDENPWLMLLILAFYIYMLLLFMPPRDQGVLNEDELLDEMTNDCSMESSAMDISSELSLHPSRCEGLEPAPSRLMPDALFLLEKDFWEPFCIRSIQFLIYK